VRRPPRRHGRATHATRTTRAVGTARAARTRSRRRPGVFPRPRASRRSPARRRQVRPARPRSAFHRRQRLRRATPTTPVFILVNSETAAVLRNVFAGEKSHPGLLTLGSASSAFTPDIVIPDDDDEEKLAYDALEHGAVLSSLLTENTDKPRTDEAAIVRERANAPDSAAATDDSITADPADKKSPAAAPPPPVIDRPLQRAVQVHRALVALKRL
jgi:hypothetical protein